MLVCGLVIHGPVGFERGRRGVFGGECVLLELEFSRRIPGRELFLAHGLREIGSDLALDVQDNWTYSLKPLQHQSREHASSGPHRNRTVIRIRRG